MNQMMYGALWKLRMLDFQMERRMKNMMMLMKMTIKIENLTLKKID